MIIVGADHGGFELKEKIKDFLAKSGENIVDVGAFKLDDADNFSDFVKSIISIFDKNKNAKIIALCGSGVGMTIGLNKHRGIFCVNGHTVDEVVVARKHNNVNALSIGGRSVDFEDAIEMIKAFLSTDALDGKYKKRMQDIEIV